MGMISHSYNVYDLDGNLVAVLDYNGLHLLGTETFLNFGEDVNGQDIFFRIADAISRGDVLVGKRLDTLEVLTPNTSATRKYLSQIGDGSSYLTTSWEAISGAGLGDVVGPGSSVNNDIVTFDGTTGKLIKDSGVSIASVTGSSPGGSTTQLQYNNSGAFGGISGATTNGTSVTLSSPTITTPTGIVKGDVGLGSVDNTSDASKNSASVTLTNKTINLSSNTLTTTLAQLNTAVSDADIASLTGSETLTNKTVNLTSNTLTGTTAQFNASLSDNDFTTLAGSETLTNKTLTTPVINSPTGLVKADVGLGNVDNTSDSSKNSASVTLTNKTLALGSNTVSGTKAQFDTACTDGNFLYSGDVTQYTDELAQDAVGGMLVDTNSINLTYTDATPSLTADVLVRNTTTANTTITASGVGVDVNTDTVVQRVEVVKNSGAVVSTRKQLNFIEGSNVTLTIADDSGNNQCDITIASTGGGGSGTLDDLTDVVITSPSNTEILQYNGSAWVNGANTGGSGLSQGQVLKIAMLGVW